MFHFFPTAVILPTLWLYLEHRFDAEQWFFGVVFAAFCFSNLLSSPLFGFWVDYTQKTKSAILFANLFEIGGKLGLLMHINFVAGKANIVILEVSFCNMPRSLSDCFISW